MLVGKLVQNAAINELYMFGAFQILSKCNPKIAAAIFYTLDSFPGKKTLLTRVCAISGDDRDKELVDAIIDASYKSNNQRQQVSHGLALSQDENDNPQIILNPKSMDPKPVSHAFATHLLKHSSEALFAGKEKFELLSQKHGVPPVPRIE